MQTWEGLIASEVFSPNFHWGVQSPEQRCRWCCASALVERFRSRCGMIPPLSSPSLCFWKQQSQYWMGKSGFSSRTLVISIRGVQGLGLLLGESAVLITLTKIVRRGCVLFNLSSLTHLCGILYHQCFFSIEADCVIVCFGSIHAMPDSLEVVVERGLLGCCYYCRLRWRPRNWHRGVKNLLLPFVSSAVHPILDCYHCSRIPVKCACCC